MFGFKRLFKKSGSGDKNQNKPDVLVGYSALDLFEECYEYNENACYVADTIDTLHKFLKGAMFKIEDYRIDSVKILDILNDFGYSGGEYALEPKALERFKNAAKVLNIKYSVEPYEDPFDSNDLPDLFIVNVETWEKRNRHVDNLQKDENPKEIKDIEIHAILRKLKFNDRVFPREALTKAIANQDLITPYLLEIIKDAIENLEYLEKEESYMAHIYAMYLLAQFREKRAYTLIIDFFSIPGEITLDVTGDLVTETLGRILASVSCGDISLIKSLIEKREVNEYVRLAGIKSLVTLVACGEIGREEIMAYFQSLYRGRLERKFSQVWNELVSACTDLYPEEVYEDIKQAYEDNLVSPRYINIDNVEEALSQGKDRHINRIQDDCFYKLIKDTVREIEWWACFKEPKSHRTVHQPEPVQVQAVVKKQKVGRNAPCPCGSGKKYKKCCGR